MSTQPDNQPRRIARGTPTTETAQTVQTTIKPIYLDLPTVAAVTSMSISTIEKLVREDAFPAPRILSGRRVAYLLSEVEAWCASRPVSQLPPPPNTGRRKTIPSAVRAVLDGQTAA